MYYGSIRKVLKLLKLDVNIILSLSKMEKIFFKVLYE